MAVVLSIYLQYETFGSEFCSVDVYPHQTLPSVASIIKIPGNLWYEQ